MFNKCKTSNTLIISKDAKVGAKRTKALKTCTNSPTHPMAKFRANQHEKGAIRIESKLNKVIDAPIIETRLSFMLVLAEGVSFKVLPNH